MPCALTSCADTGRDHEGVPMRTTSDSNWVRRTSPIRPTVMTLGSDDSNWVRDAHWRDANWRDANWR